MHVQLSYGASIRVITISSRLPGFVLGGIQQQQIHQKTKGINVGP